MGWVISILTLPSLILASSSSIVARPVPSESVHEFCQRYAEDYARRNQGGGALDGAARGAAGGAIFGAILGDPLGGAAAGAGLGAIGSGVSRSEANRSLQQQAYDRCVRERYNQ